jgi:hypothetical protein
MVLTVREERLAQMQPKVDKDKEGKTQDQQVFALAYRFTNDEKCV